MDKETLSNYGWIVIAVLVLVVMIALATPFGSYVSSAVKRTTTGLFETNRSALNATGLINVEDQKFADEEKTADVTTTVTATIGTKSITVPKDSTWQYLIDNNPSVFGQKNGYVTVASVDAVNGLAVPSKKTGDEDIPTQKTNYIATQSGEKITVNSKILIENYKIISE